MGPLTRGHERSAERMACNLQDHLGSSRSGMTMLRAATSDDVEAIADVWHRGWRDGHLGHVPDGLAAHRSRVSSRSRAVPRHRYEKRVR